MKSVNILHLQTDTNDTLDRIDSLHLNLRLMCCAVNSHTLWTVIWVLGHSTFRTIHCNWV